jgi:hypothetical protein
MKLLADFLSSYHILAHQSPKNMYEKEIEELLLWFMLIDWWEENR